MKKILRMISLVTIMIFAQACSKDDDNQITIQEHDKNQMMSIMHGLLDKMGAMQKTNDPDNDFAMMMKMHHQGAIEMSNEELKSGDDAQMKKTAQMIIDAQTVEIGQLTAFLNSHPTHTQIYPN
ncbi:MAG: DUF305 domain-containing protein [Oligoflexus sp.]|nr:DUF305 domain-containing protein [Pseudopedobacter sp.]